MKNIVGTFLLSLTLLGCNVSEEATAASANLEQQKIWVFIQFNVPEEGNKIESYYYYGKISESLYKKISNNKITRGFILLENVKYWGDKDIIYSYSDRENQGNLLFRIEDIRKLKLVKSEPIVGKGSEQFDEPKVADGALNKSPEIAPDSTDSNPGQ